jgi:hypothetical protein
MVFVGVTVGVEVGVGVTLEVMVCVGDKSISAVTMGAATIVVPPQPVNNMDITKVKRIISCFIWFMKSMMVSIRRRRLSAVKRSIEICRHSTIGY